MKKFKVRIPASITVVWEARSAQEAKQHGRVYEGCSFTLPAGNQFPFLKKCLGDGHVEMGKVDITDVEEVTE